MRRKIGYLLRDAMRMSTYEEEYILYDISVSSTSCVRLES